MNFKELIEESLAEVRRLSPAPAPVLGGSSAGASRGIGSTVLIRSGFPISILGFSAREGYLRPLLSAMRWGPLRHPSKPGGVPGARSMRLTTRLSAGTRPAALISKEVVDGL